MVQVNNKILLQALLLLIRVRGVSFTPANVYHENAVDPNNPTDLDISKIALYLSFHLKKRKIDPFTLKEQVFPIIALEKDGHSLVILKPAGEGKLLIQDFKTPRPIIITKDEFNARSSGELIFSKPKGLLADTIRKFDISWFIPVIKKYKGVLIEVVLASFFIQFIALLTPLFFQVIMDKVLVHRALSTLTLIVIGLGVAALFEAAISLLRSYIFTHTVSRIDVELGAKLFRHVLALPIGYFQARRVGDTIARLRELETIRSFLTGQAVTALMDAVFSVLFLAVMYYYSPALTLVVLISLVCYFLLSLVFTPVLRENLRDKFTAGADNQAYLVETVSGIETLKAMAIEPNQTKIWDEKLATYVNTVFRTSITENAAGVGVTLISKITNAIVLFYGAYLVIDNQLSVGQLIAFNMLSGQVSGPIVRLAQLWTSFQQISISVDRLGDVLNTPTELVDNKVVFPQLKGHIVFNQISFRYRPDTPEVLKDFSLEIPAGKIIGLVGRSGSGKSTVTKLVQRLYIPERGRILIDGFDLAHGDIPSLRRQIGVVLQENILFNRTVRENIALAVPGAPIEAVIAAAQAAGAHEFISEMTQGYDSMVGEHGSSLSGGQKQRVALARALICNPRVLILDEATSALDYESERIILNNMPIIAKDRTVIIIAHRLSCVRGADMIYVMDKGRIVQAGSHDEMVSVQNSPYFTLHKSQYE